MLVRILFVIDKNSFAEKTEPIISQPEEPSYKPFQNKNNR